VNIKPEMNIISTSLRPDSRITTSRKVNVVKTSLNILETEDELNQSGFDNENENRGCVNSVLS